MAEVTLYRLNLYDSIQLLPVQLLVPGTRFVAAAPFGNSILSTLWVKSVEVGASIEVKWFDYGPGPELYPGEKVYLKSHKIISSSDVSDRVVISKIHNKAIAEIIVTGGNVEAGIFITSISSFPVDAPYPDGVTYNSENDAGNAQVLLNDGDGKFYIWRGTQEGAANVNITGGTILEAPFNVKILSQQAQTTPAINQVLINANVPSGKNWRLRNLKLATRAYGKFIITANSVIIGEGFTGPAESNAKYEIFPYWPIASALNIKVEFIQSYGPAMDVSAYLQLTEQDN